MTSFIGQENLPRGLRDNNPGNIRPSTKYKWNGQIGIDEKGGQGKYVIFQDVEHGIRAMAKDLSSKIFRGLNTLNKYIPVYAPPDDSNNTLAYIKRVSHDTGIAPDELLFADHVTLCKLVKAHISVEIGDKSSHLITDAMIQTGVKMATG